MLHTAPAALNSLVRLPDTGGGVTFGERRTRVPQGSARALTGPEPVALGLTRLPPLTLADTLVTITAGIGVPVAQVEVQRHDRAEQHAQRDQDTGGQEGRPPG